MHISNIKRHYNSYNRKWLLPKLASIQNAQHIDFPTCSALPALMPLIPREIWLHRDLMKKKSARIGAELKAQASSDAKGIPLSIGARGRVRHVPAEQLWEMKRAAQARGRASAASSDLSNGERLLIRPHQLRKAKVRWSSAKMSD